MASGCGIGGTGTQGTPGYGGVSAYGGYGRDEHPPSPSGPRSSPRPAIPRARLAILLAGSPDEDKVFLTISSVSLLPKPTEQEGQPARPPRWQKMAGGKEMGRLGKQPILLAAQRLILVGEVALGEYSQVRLGLSQKPGAHYLLAQGNKRPIKPAGDLVAKLPPLLFQPSRTCYLLLQVDLGRLSQGRDPGASGYSLPTDALSARIGEGLGSIAGSISPPSAQAKVAALIPERDVVVEETKADPQTGSFSLSLPPGQYSLRVIAPGYQPSQPLPSSIAVAPKERAEAGTILLSPARTPMGPRLLD